MKIDSETMIPIGWVMTIFAAMVGSIIVGVFWVASVNFRLGRIEEKLNIKPIARETASYEALAGEK